MDSQNLNPFSNRYGDETATLAATEFYFMHLRICRA